MMPETSLSRGLKVQAFLLPMFEARSREEGMIMKLDPHQLKDLLNLTVTTKADSIGCDGCYELMDQFAQAELDGRSIPESLRVVRDHLEQCKCCRDEYAALLAALHAISE